MRWIVWLTMTALRGSLVLTTGSCARWDASDNSGPPLMLGAPVVTPDALLQGCRAAVRLPDRAMRVSEVARLWGRDRVALSACAGRHGTLARHVRALEAQDLPLP